MPQNTPRLFDYTSPADAAWGQVTNNLVEAIFGDPQAAAQAKVQRAQIEQLNAQARQAQLEGDRTEYFNNNLYRVNRDNLVNSMFMPENSAAVVPQPPMPATSIGGVPIAPATGGAQAVPNGQGGFTWVKPVASDRITSGFGPRSAPIAGASTNHGGIDLAAAMGVPVAAAGPGEVLDAWVDTKHGGGNSVRVRHPDGSITGYAHLNDYLVKKGDQVTAGQRIGSVGATGRATGPHLHMTYRANANAPRSDPSFILKGGQVAAPSGVAAAMTGGSVSGQPVGQVAAPQMLAEPGGAQIDPRGMAAAMTELIMAGFDPNDAKLIALGASAWGNDAAQRGALVFQGQQPGENFAASRGAQLNNIGLGAYNDTAEAVAKENIGQVGQTGRQNTVNATNISMNNADNATRQVNAQAAAQAAAVKAATKEGSRKITASDTNAMAREFESAVPVKENKRDASLGAMRVAVLTTASNYLSTGEAMTHSEAVQMALQAHGVNQGPSSKDPNRQVWRWQREPKVVPGQQIVRTPAGSGGKVTVTNW